MFRIVCFPVSGPPSGEMFQSVEETSEALTIIGFGKPEHLHAVLFFMYFGLDSFVEFFRQLQF
jgi:hypothetical protein